MAELDFQNAEPVYQILSFLESFDNSIELNTKGQAKRARIPVTTGASDSITLNAYQKRIPLYIYGIKADGTTQSISNATGYTVTGTVGNTAIDDTRAIINSALDKTLLAGNFYLLFGINGSVTISWNTGYFTSVYMLYVNQPDVVTYERVKFITTAAQTTYDDTMLRGMEIGLVLYGQSALDVSQWSLNGSTLTINPGTPVDAGLQLIVLPTSLLTYCTTTVANQTAYNSAALNGVTVKAVILGQQILDSTQYTHIGSTVTLTSAPAAGLQLVVISSNDVYVSFTTTANVSTYTSTGLNGVLVDFAFYGQHILDYDTEYSLSGTTFTLNLSGPVEGNLPLLIWKIRS